MYELRRISVCEFEVLWMVLNGVSLLTSQIAFIPHYKGVFIHLELFLKIFIPKV